MKQRILAGAALAALFGAGCCMLPDDPEPIKVDEIVAEHKNMINRAEELDLLCGKAWVPVYVKGQEGVDGKNAIELPPEIQAYIEFHRDGKVTGFAGVNNFQGSFAVTAPNLLRFGALTTSQQSGTHLDYEMLFMAQVNEVANFSVGKDGQLELWKRNVLMIRCKPADPAKLAKQPKPKTTAPVPPKVSSTIAPEAKAGDPGASAANPALPTVEKASSGMK